MLKLAYGRPFLGPGHSHNDVEINFVFKGFLRYFISGHMQTVGEGQLGVFWAGFPHFPRGLAPETTMLWVTLPMRNLLQWNLGKSFVNALFEGELILTNPSNDADARINALLAQRWFDAFHVRDTRAESLVLLELQAVLERMAMRYQRKKSPPGNDVQANRVEQVTDIIRHHYHEPIDVSFIAKRLGLHPKYLMQLFKKQVHLSIYQYLLQVRLAHAQHLLLTTDLKILDIALAVGFGSARQFYQGFQRQCGMSPGQFRVHYRS